MLIFAYILSKGQKYVEKGKLNMKKEIKKNQVVQIFCSGKRVEEGIYCCINCGKKLYLENLQVLPICPKCGSKKFTFER